MATVSEIWLGINYSRRFNSNTLGVGKYAYRNYRISDQKLPTIRLISFTSLCSLWLYRILFDGYLKEFKCFKNEESMPKNNKLEQVTLGGGCFWCTESVYKELKGIVSVVSGYSGGNVPNPTYEQVCSGETNHAEVIQITYHTGELSFADVLKVFFATHDPTTLNRQGEDVGTQYRSVIYYHTSEQRQLAEALISNFNRTKIYNAPVVTQVEPFEVFYKAENYHQDYLANHPENTFCKLVVIPKRDKFRKLFHDMLK